MILRPFPPARPAVRVAQRFFDAFGFQLVDYRPACTEIKDADFYRPMLSPWLMPEWRNRLRADDAHSLLPLHARYNLYCLADQARKRLGGDFAECGVYQGGTAKILANIARGRPVHLFDTFSGMPETDAIRDLHKAGDFADTSLEAVREYLSEEDNVNCVMGMIPRSLEAVSERRFAFVHIDLDIYEPIKAACEFFYPRMQPGGILLFDDYGYPSCPGARTAVDEFFSDKPEILFVMITGQCSVQKL